MSLRSPGLVSVLALEAMLAVTLLGACGGSGDSTQPGGSAGMASGGVAASGAGNLAGSAAGTLPMQAGAGGAVAGAATAGGAGSAVGGSGSGTGGGSEAGTGGGGGASGSGAGTSAGGAGGRDFSTNRDAFFGESRCAAAKLQFCEDFESGTLDAATWKTGGTAPVIDELQAARGKKALHIGPIGAGNSQIRTSKPFPAMNGRYWGRAFFYANAMPHNSADADSLSYAHWTILAATGAVVNGEVRIGGQLQKRYQNPAPLNFWGVGTDSGTQPEGTGDWTNSDDDPKGAAKAVVEKQWQCLEWMGDYMTDETKFFLDGTEHPSLDTSPMTKHGGNATKPFLLPEFSAIWFGWAEYQATTQKWELWFDELAIDPERIGCVL
jgi:hypothetical protein